MKILITGATGLLGKKIGQALVYHGHQVVVVSRQSKTHVESLLPFPCEVLQGDLNQGPLKGPLLDSVEGVIHLMGEPVAQKKWSQVVKKKIFDSRVLTTKNLIQSLKKCEVFISTSAIGIYGDRKDEELAEDSAVDTKDFLASVCIEWEAEALKINERFPNCRCIIPRLGVVLAQQGGALDKMIFPFRCGVGGALGSGDQWMSWIHIDDLVQIYIQALTNHHWTGVLNAVAPQSVSNFEFSKALSAVLKRPLGPAIPKFILKVLFGEMSQVLLSSQKVLPKKLESFRFEFKFPKLEGALNDLLKDLQPLSDGSREDVFLAEQFLPLPKEIVFNFFSKAENLEKITPEILQFRIQSISTKEIQNGTLIDYRLKIHGIPAKWKTEIEKWNPPFHFIDNQLKGPYKLWHHTHEFEDFAGGTLMKDKVRFRLPFGFLGWLGGFHFVKSDVTKIFEYRRQAVAQIDWSRET